MLLPQPRKELLNPSYGYTVREDILLSLKKTVFRASMFRENPGQAANQPPVSVSAAKKQKSKPKVLLLPEPSRFATRAVNYLPSKR